MSETTINGRPKRKQLSEQLDRLDGIIDALADGLNKAVADAAREGTRLAVKDAILEILSNPELRALIVPQMPATPTVTESAVSPTTTAAASTSGGPRGTLSASLKSVGDAARTVVGQAARRGRRLWHSMTAAVQMAASAVSMNPVLSIAIGVGVTAGVGHLTTPHTLTMAAGSIAVAVVAVTAAVGSRLRRAARWLGMVG